MENSENPENPENPENFKNFKNLDNNEKNKKINEFLKKVNLSSYVKNVQINRAEYFDNLSRLDIVLHNELTVRLVIGAFYDIYKYDDLLQKNEDIRTTKN